jgi:integrase
VHPDVLVFTNGAGTPVKQSDFLMKHQRPAAVRAKIAAPLPRTHDLRLTAASLMAVSGLSLLEAGQQPGHTATAMTAAYSHLWRVAR